jgi:hypothetical protein
MESGTIRLLGSWTILLDTALEIVDSCTSNSLDILALQDKILLKGYNPLHQPAHRMISLL